jgi:hypothetical protein
LHATVSATQTDYECFFGADAEMRAPDYVADLIEQFGFVLHGLARKISTMSSISRSPGSNSRRIRPKKCVFKGAKIGPNSR